MAQQPMDEVLTNVQTHSLLSSQQRELRNLKRLIWLYFWLLIFEGALRKWTIPALSAPLLIVRDPVVILIYVQALRCRRFPAKGPMLACFGLMAAFVLLALGQIIAGIGGGPLVALYGLRTNFLHLPLIFIIPEVFGYADVVKLGKWVLMLSIPMAALMVLQYKSPPGAWVNAATKADAQQLAFTGDKIRPPGTFSFITGAAHFFVLATAFLLYGLGEKRRVYSGWLLCAATLSVAVVQPVSGSRLLVLSCAMVLAGALAFAVLNPGRAQRILAIMALLCIAALALSMTDMFREAVTTFSTRWEQANTSSGGSKEGLFGRVLSWFTEPLGLLPEAGIFGKGIGMGTNAASAMLTGALAFLLAETEWSRVVLESGPFLGVMYLFYRVWIGGMIAMRAIWAGKRQELLPWLLASGACFTVVTEPISQPTSLGFMVFGAGLCLASISDKRIAASGLAQVQTVILQPSSIGPGPILHPSA